MVAQASHRGGKNYSREIFPISSHCRNYPLCHGASSISLTGAGSSGATASSGSSTRWLLLGQEGGAVSRSHINRLMQQTNVLTADSFKSSPAVEEVYPSIKRGDDGFTYDPHIGYVHSIAASPFHRSVLITYNYTTSC
jgi:hypothetical protein